MGEDPDGFGPPNVYSVGVALPGENLGDPIHGGFEPDGITGGGAGNDQLQTVLRRAAEPHEPFPGSGGGLLFGAFGVGLVDGGLQQGLQPAPRHRPQRCCNLLVHQGCLFEAEVAGGFGDRTGLVGRRLPGLRGRPHRRQPVPQIQRIPDQPRR